MKHLTLSQQELEEFKKFKSLASYDPETGKNSFPEYKKKLSEWTKSIRKKYDLKEEEPFTF